MNDINEQQGQSEKEQTQQSENGQAGLHSAALHGYPFPIQDAGNIKKNEGQIAVYHTHGVRQYFGTAKYHKSPWCRVLMNWRPRKGLEKTIIREWWNNYDEIYREARCKVCFKG